VVSSSVYNERTVCNVAGKYINGALLLVDGGEWLSKPRNISKEQLRQFGRAVEQRSRATTLPNSKL